MKRVLFSLIYIFLILSVSVKAGISEKNAQLIQALKDGNLNAVKNTLDEGTNVNAELTSDGTTALMWASMNGQTEIVKILLEKGADVNAKTTNGTTALWIAVQSGRTEIVKLLLEKGADVNVKTNDYGVTTLMQAAKYGHMEITQLLLAKGADVYYIDKDGVTALSMAAQEGHPEIVKLLGATEIIDKIVSNLEFGNIAFNAPSEMLLGELVGIELIVSPRESIESLQKMIDDKKEVEGYKIKISDEMEVMLSGQDFKIEAVLPERQLIGNGKVTKWKWQVEATKRGDHLLHLTVSAVLFVNGRSGTYVIRTFERNIKVNVTFGDWISSFVVKNWQWLLSTLLIPVVTWLVTWLFCKRRKKSKKKSSE